MIQYRHGIGASALPVIAADQEGRSKEVGDVRTTSVLICAMSVVALAGCEGIGTAAQSKTNQGALMGGLLGAGTGAILGNQMGHHAGAGTAIGAGLGALGGAMVGHGMEEQDRKIQQQQFPPASTAPGVIGASAATVTGKTKFCPVGGEVFPEDVKYCPNHGVELRYKEYPVGATRQTTGATGSARGAPHRGA